MIKSFIAIFLGFAIYGVATKQYGGAMLSAVMVGFMFYARKELRQRDIEYYCDPKHAERVPDTVQLLEDYGCEAGQANFQG